MVDLNESKNVEEEQDRVKGGSSVMESGIRKLTIDLAYMGESSGGAVSVTLHLKDKETGTIIRQTEYITSGKAKGQKTFYTKDGKDFNLPGFNLINNLCLLAAGKPIAKLDKKTRTVKLYDFTLGKETPQDVDALPGLMGQEITAGVLKQIENKNKKNDAGEYVPTAALRTYNVVDKFFHPKSEKTVAEIRAKADEAVFIGKWKDKWDGVTNDISVAVAGGAQSGAPGSTVVDDDDDELFGED